MKEKRGRSADNNIREKEARHLLKYEGGKEAQPPQKF